MRQIKVLVVSSVVPSEAGSAGEAVLHRYMTLSPSTQYEVVRWQRFPLRLKLIGKLRQLGFQSFSRSWECLFPVFPPKKLIRDLIERFQPDILLTVAHGWWHIQARRIAKQYNLPLVSLFQDWWPDFPDVPVACRSRVEREFRRTCADSAVAICVSTGMQQELGAPSNSVVIYPIPLFKRSQLSIPNTRAVMRIAYFGNLSEYGPLVEGALRSVNSSHRVRLEVFGRSPSWTRSTEQDFRSRGLYHGFPSTGQLVELLRSFQGVLVIMSFDGALRRRMITSFPSKMIEGMQLGLPTVIWGPPYCSAAQWARKGDRALCVTNANPAALRQALEELAASPLEQERLAESACHAAANDFNLERIQAQFIGALRQAICPRDVSNA